MKSIVTSNAGIRLALSLLAFGFYFMVLAQGEYPPDRDVYFHLQIAREILSQGFVTTIPQMAHAIHAERYVDYHFLFHYALVPFVTLFGDALLAARVATAVFAALAVFALDLLLTQMRVQHRWFWILAFVLISPIFTGRLLFGRGVTLFIGILFWFLLCLSRKRYRRAGGIAALAVWTYPGFPVLIGFAGLYWLSDLLQRGQARFAILLWPLAGALFAFIVHPAFPNQFYGYWLEFVVHSLAPGDMDQIAEWLAPSRALLFIGLSVPLGLFLGILLSARRHDALGAALLATTIVFLLASAVSLKTFEYVIPFLIVYAARQSRVYFLPARRSGALNEKTSDKNLRRTVIEAACVAVAALLLLWSMPQISRRMVLQFELEDPTPQFAAADWLAGNTPRGSLVALQWDEFPAFYFRNPGNRYLFGLNPVYSYGADRRRYQISRRFFSPATVVSASDSVQSPDLDLIEMGARFAVLDRRTHGRTLVLLLEGPNRTANAIFHNERFVVIELRDSVR